MSDFKAAFASPAAFTITNANLASSATAGWKSNAIDNSSNLFLDALVSINLAAVNTAPANNKAINLYAYSMVDGTNYAGSGAAAINGSEGTLTFPDITQFPCNLTLLGQVPYNVQNVAIISPAFAVARCFGGILPAKWGIAMINYSGMTLSVNSIYYQAKYNTVI